MSLRLPVAAALLVLSACATRPAPLQGSFSALTPHAAVVGDHTGTEVRWGGRIIRTEPRQGRTCFEMISTRLDGSGRPLWTGDSTWGRFIACRTGFYDPALFQPQPTQQQTHIGPLLLQAQAGIFSTRTGVGREGKAPQVSAHVHTQASG